MEPATRGTLRTIAGQLAVIVGVVHLGLGAYYTVGGTGVSAGDPRILLWALAGAALVAGVGVAAVGWHRRLLYALGLALAGLLLAAHLLWPVLAGASFYLGPIPTTPRSDPLGYALELLLRSEPVAEVAVATELALAAFLAVLLKYEGRY